MKSVAQTTKQAPDASDQILTVRLDTALFPNLIGTEHNVLATYRHLQVTRVEDVLNLPQLPQQVLVHGPDDQDEVSDPVHLNAPVFRCAGAVRC